MSDNIPLDIQVEIIKRVLPVKSLIRFRSVSKQWKSLIDSSEFISQHYRGQPRHLLVMSKVDYDEYEIVSIADDDSFPSHEFYPCVPQIVKQMTDVKLLGSSNGLVCLYGSCRYLKKNLIVLWNPSIRKYVDISFPLGLTTVGFGVCPKTSEPKIVKMTRVTHSKDWQAEVLTLSSRTWRSVPMPYILSEYVFKSDDRVVIDGVIHWLVLDSRYQYLIISFDLISEEFGELHLPEDCLEGSDYLSISKLKESLVVVTYFDGRYIGICNQCVVWMMKKDGDLKPSYTKKFTASIELPFDSMGFKIAGFKNNGEPIMDMHTINFPDEWQPEYSDLHVYDPFSKQLKYLGISSIPDDSPGLTFYSESLLLLNHPDSMVFWH